MRNLSLAASSSTILPDNAQIRCWTTDLDQNVDYVASEHINADADVEIEVYKVAKDDGNTVSLFSTFTSTASLSAVSSQVVSLRILLDDQQLVAVLRGGDITVVSLEEGTSDVVGTVEGGIAAACWSPDDSTLTLVTGDDKLILMTSSFDVLSEAALHPEEFGEDAPINVGWGSKQTQFHGSAGKAAATVTTKTTQTVSPDDDLVPRITWRGDGAYFAISSIAPKDNHRKFRVYDRQAILQSTSEDVPGLEHSLAWRPSGNLIAATQRFGYPGGGAGKEGRHDIVFFERNGLRHGEFGLRVADLGIDTSLPPDDNLRWGYEVKDLRWSSDSNVLAVWIRTRSVDLVQLWTIGNYHWYLKQEVAAPGSGRFTSVEWHPEKALALVLTMSNRIIQRTYAWETCTSPTRPPIDSGSVCVVDGATLYLTPFRTQNVPPPMSSHQLSLGKISVPPSTSHIPVHTTFGFDSDVLAILWESGLVELWDLETRLGPGRGKVMQPSLRWSFSLSDRATELRQITVLKRDIVAVLGYDAEGSDVLFVVERGELEPKIRDKQLPGRNGHLVTANDSLVWQSLSGEIFKVDSQTLDLTLAATFPSPCWTASRIAVPNSGTFLFIGLSESGKLCIALDSSSNAQLVHNATSFTVASGFLIFTTGSHEVVFASLSSLIAYLEATNDGQCDAVRNTWEKRRVERGSRIVVPVPSAMSLVLQMPRGNLETINPRPLVMEVVKQDLDAKRYRKAFDACRKHRIDLNVLVEHDRDVFLENISTFVEQVEDVDYINLFLTNVGRSTQPPDAIADICDAVRLELEKRDLTTYVNSILTAHVVKTPPDHEAGLSLLLQLRDGNPALVEDAIKYIIFLVDAEKLYNTALGMYDFELVLMIAQHAQKDPREYLPFLRELRAMEKYMQRFKIDDHLKRYNSALRNIKLAGDAHFEEAVAYIERYSLYETALAIWKGTSHFPAVLIIYGDWLFERREFRQAAAVFVEARALHKAMVAYEKALEWQNLFDLAIRTDMSEEDIVATGYRVAEDLSSKKRHSEAARVLLDYAVDVREAVSTLTLGNAFSEARRVATLQRRPELLEDILHPAALDSRAQIADDLREIGELLQKQFIRLLELRVKRVEEPDAFFGVEDTTLQNVDVMTDVSMPYTAFTRYTVAPTALSKGSSKRTARSKRKQERKVGSGRKGTVDEEEYLVKSLVKLVGRFVTSRDEARHLIPHLFEFSPEHREEGLALQKEVEELERKLKDAVEEIWKQPVQKNADGFDEPASDSWRTRMEEAEKAKLRNPTDSIAKPEVGANSDWRLNLLDHGI